MTLNEPSANLHHLFQRAVEKAYLRRGKGGKVGKHESDGTIAIDVEERPGLIYVEPDDGGPVVECMNGGITPLPDLPVRIVKTHDGYHEAITNGIRTNVHLSTAAGFVGNVPPHTHEKGGGLDDYVSPNRFRPGLVHATNPVSMSVQIEAFNLPDDILVATSLFDMTPYLPGTANTWQWVKVGYDIDAQEFVVVEGTEVPTLVPLNEADLSAISTVGYVPLGAVRLREDDTTIPDVDANRVARFAIEDTRLFVSENAPRRESGIVKLATVAGVDLNTSTPATLYAAEKTAIPTHFVVRLASTSLTTVSFSIGWNSAVFNNVVADATHTELTGNTLYSVLPAKAGAAIGTAGSLLKLLCNTLQGGAATVTIDVFGYLY